MPFDEDWIAPIETAVKDHVRDTLSMRRDAEVFDIDRVEAGLRSAMQRLACGIMQAWGDHASQVAIELGGPCPGCEQPRKVRRRSPMTVTMLGLEVEIPKPYLDCGRCDAPGVSIMPLLTGLRSGVSSSEVALMASYCGAEKTYGRASRDLAVHHGIEVERTAVRRMALEVEKLAIGYADAQRERLLADAGREVRKQGIPCLMLQADGGSVRVGELRPTRPGEAGHGKLTPKTKRPRCGSRPI